MPKIFTRRNLIIAGVVILAIILATWIFWPKKSTQPTGTFVETVRKGSIKVTVSGSGVISPNNSTDIMADVTGKLTKINVSEGQLLEKGDLLFVLENQAIILARDKAKLALAQAKDALSRKEAERSKLNILAGINGQVTSVRVSPGDQLMAGVTVANVQEGATSREVKATVEGQVKEVFVKTGDSVTVSQKIIELSPDALNASIESLRLQVKQAELDLEEKEQDVKDLKIYAPISGTYTGLNVAVGDSVGQSSSQTSLSSALSSATSSQNTSSSNLSLGVINDNAIMKVVVPVDELDIAKVKEGQKARIIVSAIQDKVYYGSVGSVAAQGNSSNGVSTFEVTVFIDDPGQLKPGMSAEVEIEVAEKKDILVLPIEAVQHENGRNFVFLTTSGNKERKPNSTTPANVGRRAVAIETGINNQQYIEIVSGLSEGDEVILPMLASGQENGLRVGPSSDIGKNMGSMRRSFGGSSNAR